MESEHELREKIIAFLQGAIVDLQINYAEGQGEIALLLEKFRNGDFEDIDEVLEDVQDAFLHKGYRDGIIKMSKGIINLITE